MLERQEQIDEREAKAKEYAIWLKEEEARKTAWRIRSQEVRHQYHHSHQTHPVSYTHLTLPTIYSV